MNQAISRDSSKRLTLVAFVLAGSMFLFAVVCHRFFGFSRSARSMKEHGWTGMFDSELMLPASP